MTLIKTFLTEREALAFIDTQKGGYFIDRDIFSGKFNVYLMS